MTKIMDMKLEMIDTGISYFGHRVYLESSKSPFLDEALKRVFARDFNKSKPLEMSDPDVQLCLQAQKGENPCTK